MQSLDAAEIVWCVSVAAARLRATRLIGSLKVIQWIALGHCNRANMVMWCMIRVTFSTQQQQVNNRENNL
jgi:hypothetical protein